MPSTWRLANFKTHMIRHVKLVNIYICANIWHVVYKTNDSRIRFILRTSIENPNIDVRTSSHSLVIIQQIVMFQANKLILQRVPGVGVAFASPHHRFTSIAADTTAIKQVRQFFCFVEVWKKLFFLVCCWIEVALEL